MTTVAYRDGHMAADTRAFSGDKQPMGFKEKIFRLSDGTLVGVSSANVGAPTEFLQWLKGQNLKKLEEAVSEEPYPVQALVALPNGRVFYWNDGQAFTGPLWGEYFAIGSGEQSALAAMILGKTAAQAVDLAIQVDPWTAGKVMVISHD